MPAPDDLRDFIGRELRALSHRDDPDVVRLTEAIRTRHGSTVAAVLLYGSYLRGKRDTVLDFYVLLDGFHDALPRGHALGNRLLPPNVYYLSLPQDPAGGRPAVRAKYATMTLAQFETAMSHFHSYFWSRFTQPAGLVTARGEGTERRVVDAMAAAVDTFVARTLPLLPAPFSSQRLWQTGLARTYACELRSESAAGIESLYACNDRHFDALLAAYAGAGGSRLVAGEQGYTPAARTASPRAARLGWGVRRVQGKILSVLRLVKAAGTFDDPLDYLLWKIERHSGIYIEPSERARRHPLVFAWPLLWRLYRRGAFR